MRPLHAARARASLMRMRVLVLPLLALGACKTVQLEGSQRHSYDPVVIVHGAGGDELGVATDYGVLFLGRTAQSGRIEFTAWYGDGPSREEGVVESIGSGVYATEAEILLPAVQLCFALPPPGTELVVRGRTGGVPFEILAELVADPQVQGVLLRPNEPLDELDDHAIGAGVFLVEEGRPLRLVGLLSGELSLADKRYYTALGPEEFWRLVLRRRNSDRPRRAVYREDIL